MVRRGQLVEAHWLSRRSSLRSSASRRKARSAEAASRQILCRRGPTPHRGLNTRNGAADRRAQDQVGQNGGQPKVEREESDAQLLPRRTLARAPGAAAKIARSAPPSPWPARPTWPGGAASCVVSTPKPCFASRYLSERKVRPSNCAARIYPPDKRNDSCGSAAQTRRGAVRVRSPRRSWTSGELSNSTVPLRPGAGSGPSPRCQPESAFRQYYGARCRLPVNE